MPTVRVHHAAGLWLADVARPGALRQLPVPARACANSRFEKGRSGEQIHAITDRKPRRASVPISSLDTRTVPISSTDPAEAERDGWGSQDRSMWAHVPREDMC